LAVKNNRGVTLVELLIAMAIISFIMIAVGGVMTSNNSIFRKSKADLTVQTDAQSTYNRITENIMQAKHVYVEGYMADIVTTSSDDGTSTTASAEIPFDKYKAGQEYTAPINLTYVKLVSAADAFALTNCDKSLTAIEDFIKAFSATSTTYSDTQKNEFANKCKNALASTCTKDGKFCLNAFVNKVRYMTDSEAEEYAWYLFNVRSENEYRASSDSSKAEAKYSLFLDVGSEVDGTNIFNNIYVTKLMFEYETKLDDSTDRDQVIEYYRFDGGKSLYCTTDYGTMTYQATYRANSDYDIIEGPYTDDLNYVIYGGNYISGVKAQLDGENDGIQLDLYFVDNGMAYTSQGMVTLRNSYVLHDAN